MEPQICVNCRNLLTSGWSQGFHHHQKPSSRRINFLRSSQRSAPQHPTFTHSGRRSALSQCDSESSQCPLCRELRALLVARDRKGRKGPGQVKWTKPTVASFPLGRDLVGRASDALDAVAKLWRDPDVFTVRFEYTTSGPNPNQVYIHTDSGWSFAWFKIFVERDSVAAEFIPGRPTLWDTTSDDTIGFIRNWIKDCDTRHSCFVPPTPTGRPKRLLKIGHRGIGGAPDVRLIETEEVQENPLRYIALSYCWGDSAVHTPLVTLRANVDAHKKNIEFSSLPKTIKDAITVCTWLGVTYVWIDALCIVQDSGQDKILEIANMGNIYAGAYLTIAASVADGASRGFLQPKTCPFFSAPMILPDGNIFEAKWCAYGRGLIGSTKQVVPASGDDRRPRAVSEFEPLHQRGWTFQESMLSRRILLFSSFQPYWVCRKASHSGGEPSPEEFLTALDLGNIISPPTSKPTDENTKPWRFGGVGDPVLQTPSSFGYYWPWVAENYSVRILSMLEDKLLAIHAVKDQYQDNNTTYLCGIWLESVHIDLLWSTIRQHPRPAADLQRFGSGWNHSRITHLPSWSWLSFDGSVRNEIVWSAFYAGKARHRDEVSSHISVIGVPETDGFGRLVGAPLCIRGRLKRILAVPVTGAGWEGRYQERQCYDISVWDEKESKYVADMADRSSLENRIGIVVFDDFIPQFVKGEAARSFAAGDLFDMREDFETEPQFVDCLLVATVGKRDGNGDGDRGVEGHGDETAYGLVLGGVKGGEKDRRCRVGMFRGHEGVARYFDDAEEMEFDFV